MLKMFSHRRQQNVELYWCCRHWRHWR